MYRETYYQQTSQCSDLLEEAATLKVIRPFNSTQDGLSRATHVYRSKRPLPSSTYNLPYNDETWYKYILPKEDLENMRII